LNRKSFSVLQGIKRATGFGIKNVGLCMELVVKLAAWLGKRCFKGNNAEGRLKQEDQIPGRQGDATPVRALRGDMEGEEGGVATRGVEMRPGAWHPAPNVGIGWD
jgi:hypothetical protein